MSIPLLDLKQQFESIKDEVMPSLAELCASQLFILGPKVEELEQCLSAYCQANYGCGVSSGSDALLVSLMSEQIGAGDEVITSPYTFFATAGAICRTGAKPVFVDIDPVTYNIDVSKIEAAITPRTKAIIPVHLYGQSADMDAILELSAGAAGWVLSANMDASPSSPARTWDVLVTAGWCSAMTRPVRNDLRFCAIMAWLRNITII